MNPHMLVNKLVPTLYEDDCLLAVEKPAGVDVGGMPGQSAPGLLDSLAKVRNRGENLEPANRLSRHESGVLLVGKDPSVVRHVRAGLKSMQISQEYVAVVLGSMRKPSLTIGAGRGISRGKGRQLAPTARRPSRVSTPTPKTEVSLIRQGEGRALVRCRTTAKNTHVLRAQLRSTGLRLLGDSLHDPSARRRGAELTCLHLSRMAFHHPGAESKVALRSRPPEAFKAVVEGRSDLRRVLHAALVRRLTCTSEPDTDSYRLLTGDMEGIKGLVVEKYGQAVVMQVVKEPDALVRSLQSIARWYRATLEADAVYVKRFVKHRPALDEETAKALRSSKPLVGRPVPEQIEITERGLKFAIRPYHGFSVGLFLDHRDNRSRVRSLAEGKDVLNLFAYTCGFSVAAAAGRAASTVSVDISPSHLEWGRNNFKLNNLDLAKHQFIRSGAFEYLKRAKRQDKSFDLMVLDPPTFAHGRKRKQDFSITRDLTDLVAMCAELLRPGGAMMVSTSYRQISLRELRDRLEHGAGRRSLKVIETPSLPVDFGSDPDHAKTIFARFV